MASIAITPSMPWDLERYFWGNPDLTKTERSVAVQILRSWDRRFWPVGGRLASQTLIGHWVGCWRSTACRALRKMVTLGMFRTTWVSVPRQTRQGIKRVTRVSVMPGPELLKLINPEADRKSAAQARGVTGSHTPRTPPGASATVGSSQIAKRADRRGEPDADSRESKRKTLAEWPRLAGSKPRDVTQLRSHLAMTLLRDQDAYRRHLAEVDAGLGLADAELELGELEAAARLEAARRRQRAEAEQRQQPRRRPPRSQR